MRTILKAIYDFKNDEFINEIHRQLTDVAIAASLEAPAIVSHEWIRERQELISVQSLEEKDLLARVTWLGEVFDEYLKKEYSELVV